MRTTRGQAAANTLPGSLPGQTSTEEGGSTIHARLCFYQLSFALLHLTLADSFKVLLVAFQCANMCCSAMEEATAKPTLTSFSFSFPLNHFILF